MGWELGAPRAGTTGSRKIEEELLVRIGFDFDAILFIIHQEVTSTDLLISSVFSF